MARAVTDTQDWSALYAGIQAQANIPGVRYVNQRGSQLTYRDPLVKLDDVIAAVQGAQQPPVFVYVFADVVVLPAMRDWAIEGIALFIVARRIVATTGTFLQLDYRGKNNATVVLYAGEIEGPLEVRAVTASDAPPTLFDLREFDSLGVQIARSADGAPVQRTALDRIDDSLLGFASDGWISLSTLCLFASVLERTQPEDSAAMFSWVKAATARSTAANDLYLQSCAALSQLLLSESNVGFVPYLSKTVYQKVATAYATAAAQYETEYQRFMQQSATAQQWIDAAGNMQKYFELTDEFNKQLIDQATQNLTAAQDAMRQATIRFTIQKNVVMQTRPLFEAGIEIWKSDQTLKAVFDILMAVVTFAAAIAAVAVGDGEAAPAAASSAAKAGEAAAAAAKAGGEAAQVAGTMQKLADSMKALQKAAESLAAIGDFMGKIQAIAAGLQTAGSLDDLAFPETDDISSQAQWDVYRLQVDNMMKFAVDNGIEHAQDYNEAMDGLAIYGKALAATQTSLVRTAQEVTRLLLQKEVSRAMTRTLATYVDKLQREKERDERMMYLVSLRGSAIKQWLFVAVQNYVSAYKYWALRDSTVDPSVVASVSQLTTDLAKMEQEYADALASFNPPPQKMVNVTVDVDDAATLAELRTSGAVRIPIGLGQRAFVGFGRVRLTRVRAWLYGARGAQQVSVNISASGRYDDRLGSTTYHFTSTPVERVFQYNGPAGDPTGIIVDGDVADEQAYAYFQPTPFTEWMISVPANLNPGIDLSTLTRISLSFAGSVNGLM